MTNLSIIVPCYNVEEYLPKCLESILNQTYKDFELICINDESSDKTLEIIEAYAKKDARVKIINQKKKGISVARNEGLKQSVGKYIGFVDSDDFIEPETYEVAIKTLEEKKADIVYWGTKIEVSETSNISEKTVRKVETYHKLKRTGLILGADEIINNVTFTIWNKLFKKEIITENKIEFPLGRFFEDNEFILKYLLFCNSMYCLDRLYYHYVQRKKSVMNSKDDTRLLDRLYVFDNVLKFYDSKDKLELLNITLNKFFNDMFWNVLNNAVDKKSILPAVENIINQIDNSKLNNHIVSKIQTKGIKSVAYIIGNKKLGFEKMGPKIIIKILGAKLKFKCKF